MMTIYLSSSTEVSLLHCPPSVEYNFIFVLLLAYCDLLLRLLAAAFIQSDLQLVHLSEERETIYCYRYSKDAHRNKCKALTIARLTHSPYTATMARIRCYTCAIIKYDIQCVHKMPGHTISRWGWLCKV